jgi:hypothetical protein
MDLKSLKALLEKYYKGESSLEEEKILKDYFSSHDVHSDLIADKDIFLYQVQETENLKVLPDISEDIWNSIAETNTPKLHKNNKLNYFYLRIAASVIILLASYFVLKNQVFNSHQEIPIADTYDNPEQAYEQAKETLLYVSALLNNGTGHLEPMHKINEGTQKLNKIASFNKGLNELKPIQEYSKADKYFKQ